MMIRTVSTLAALACFLPLAACANKGGEWPSLKTPAERQAGTCNDTQVVKADLPFAETGAPPAPTGQNMAGQNKAGQNSAEPGVAAVTARLADEQRAFSMALESWNKQRGVTEAAVAAAKNAAPASEAWATAELELSRFNQTAARFDEIRDAVNGMTGDLALLAANGANVSASLTQAGQLLRRIDDASSAHLAAVGPLQASLSR